VTTRTAHPLRKAAGGLAIVRAIVLAGVLSFGSALADTDRDAAEQREAAQREALETGMRAVVDGINAGSYAKFAEAIDSDDMLDRIFGLRLIDLRVQKSFRDQFDETLERTLQLSVTQGQEAPVKAVMLAFASRGDRGRAVVRYELENFQFAYHQYELTLGKRDELVIEDWLDFFWGERFSDGVGITLVAATPGKPAVRKLLDTRTATDAEIFELSEALKAIRDYNVPRYFEIVESMSEKLKGHRLVVLGGVQMTKQARARRQLRTALIALDQYYADEPLYANLLLDYYFPSRRYEDAKGALLRMSAELGIEGNDSVHEARMSAAELVLGDTEAAASHANRAVELEPELELGWWSALRARAALADYPGCIEALDKLSGDFGHALERDALARDRSLGGLVSSPEFAAWIESRTPDDG